jgi:hypothetical protein
MLVAALDGDHAGLAVDVHRLDQLGGGDQVEAAREALLELLDDAAAGVGAGARPGCGRA